MFEEFKKEVTKPNPQSKCSTQSKCPKQSKPTEEDDEVTQMMVKILSNPDHFLRTDMKKWLKRKLRNLEKAKEDLKKMDSETS
jgi:hypothetical protein